MEDCLKKSGEGRKFFVALETIDYSGDLAVQMNNFSKKLEVVFQKMQNLRSQGVLDPSRYAKYFTILDEKLEWYKKAEAGLV